MGGIVGGDVAAYRNGVSEGCQVLPCILDNPFWSRSEELKDIELHTPSNEEGGVTIFPDLVVLREKVHYFYVEKGAIYLYCVDPKFESVAGKNLGQQVVEVVTYQFCDGPEEN